MNKGKRLLFCKECNRKRFSTKVAIAGYNFRWTCSKGHNWIVKGVTLERIDAAMKDVFTSEKLRNLFDIDDTFYRKLK